VLRASSAVSILVLFGALPALALRLILIVEAIYRPLYKEVWVKGEFPTHTYIL
jgi:hypothetical protein